MALVEYGIVTQCIAPIGINDQYLINGLLKINAKMGGLNSILVVEHSPSIPMVSKLPTMMYPTVLLANLICHQLLRWLTHLIQGVQFLVMVLCEHYNQLQKLQSKMWRAVEYVAADGGVTSGRVF